MPVYISPLLLTYYWLRINIIPRLGHGSRLAPWDTPRVLWLSIFMAEVQLSGDRHHAHLAILQSHAEIWFSSHSFAGLSIGLLNEFKEGVFNLCSQNCMLFWSLRKYILIHLTEEVNRFIVLYNVHSETWSSLFHGNKIFRWSKFLFLKVLTKQ